MNEMSTSAAVIPSVSQPPSGNFSMTVTKRIVEHRPNATVKSLVRCFTSACFRRDLMLERSMANVEREKVRKTLMLYITTSCRTSPPV